MLFEIDSITIDLSHNEYFVRIILNGIQKNLYTDNHTQIFPNGKNLKRYIITLKKAKVKKKRETNIER